MNNATSYTVQRTEKIQWLLNNELPPLPVAPKQDSRQYHRTVKANKQRGAHCPLTIDLEPIALFTGKNPSYLDQYGKPHLVNHQVFQNRMPTQGELQRWFANPLNGIGTLGSDCVKWIDLDAKQFDDQEECDRSFNTLLQSYPVLQSTLLERTQSGGYRIGVKVSQGVDFTNFVLTPQGSHKGECLGSGRFTVLAPTIGNNGEYQCLHLPESLIQTEKLDFLYPVKSLSPKSVEDYQGASRNFSTVSLSSSILLYDLVNDETKRILKGEDIKNDRSNSLATAIAELQGWLNWCTDNGIPINGTVDDLIMEAGQRMGVDCDRIHRIIKTIDLTQCVPSAHYHSGDKACWLKVRRLNKGLFHEKCPESIKAAIQGKKTTSSVSKQDLSEEERFKLEVQEYLKTDDGFMHCLTPQR